MKQVSLIAAVDSNGGIGKNGKLPWNIPQDMKHFKEITSNSTCIMGRKTYFDMLEMMKIKNIIVKNDILPTRQSIVITSDPYVLFAPVPTPNRNDTNANVVGLGELGVFGGFISCTTDIASK